MTIVETSETGTLASIVQAIREVGPRFRERAADAERAGRVPDETIAELAAAGAFRIGAPREYGGYELPVAQQLEVISEVARWDGSTAWIVWVGATQNWIGVGCGPEAAREIFSDASSGPYLAAVGHIPATTGRARKVRDGWLVTGGPWPFGSNALWSAWSNLGVIVEGDGEQEPYLAGALIPRSDLRTVDDWRVAGMAGSGSCSVALATPEVFVPEHRCAPMSEITSDARGIELGGSLWQAPTLGWAFSTMAGMSIGLAEGVLSRFLERAKGRPIRGTSYRNQLEAPLTHHLLADVHVKIRAAKLMAQHNAEAADELGRRAASDDPASPERLQEFNSRVLFESAHAARLCAEAIEAMQRNSGSSAIQLAEPIQRAWRDARVVTLHGALNLEALAENYGRLMAGLEPHRYAGIAGVRKAG
jgi:alkylation response protein AidB-like acyl-CoA dehydrogenase